MAYDFIGHSKLVEAALVVEGLDSVAEKFRDARLGGTTSGEILKRLRYESRIALKNASVPAEVKEDLRKLISEIDNELK